VLDARSERPMPFLCFATRKRNEAWNPGSFGYRGLLVYGLRRPHLIAVRLAPECPIGFVDFPKKTHETRFFVDRPGAAE